MPNVSLSLGKFSYDVHVSNGALDSVGFFASRTRLEGRVALITDSHVYPLYGERVKRSLEDAGYNVSVHVFEAGEQSKELAYAYQCREIAADGAERVWCKLPPIETLVTMTCEGAEKRGYAREGYAFSPMFTLGYEGKLREKEVFTTWLKLEKAD